MVMWNKISGHIGLGLLAELLVVVNVSNLIPILKKTSKDSNLKYNTLVSHTNRGQNSRTVTSGCKLYIYMNLRKGLEWLSQNASNFSFFF